MMHPHSMSDQTVGILGLGVSGMAAARALAGVGAQLWLHDDNLTPDPVPPQAHLADWTSWPWDDIDTVVISPGIPHHLPVPHPAAARAAEAGIAVISEVEVALRAKPAARLVVVTGTNGKSTTTALLGHCLSSAGITTAVGGNIGDAACNLDDPGSDGVIVLEMSSYQLETTPSLRPDIAVLLNITPDHLDRHGGMDGYVAAKAKAIAALGTGGLAVMGAGDRHVRALADDLRQRITKNAVAPDLAIITPDTAPAAVRDCQALAGDHNAENAAAVAACLRQFGCSEAAIAAGITSFAGLPHRLQPVIRSGSVAFVNDSKATNGVAAARALTAFDNIFWIAGGQAKEDGLGPAADAASTVRKAYLIGACADHFASALDGQCAIALCGDLESATEAAFADASSATAAGLDSATILLSPAAASFDQFANFAERGRVFTRAAHRLSAAAAPSAPAGAPSAITTGGAHA